ncbi:MAG: radical SAM protein [Spirochaetales bacterium]|nr:radical SAM protein [Spirochaetales bacterium]
MSSSSFYAEHFRRVYAERSLRGSQQLEQALERLPPLPVEWLADRQEMPPEHRNQHTLWICSPRGRTVTRCPGSRGHLCCNYLTVDLYLGCPLGCAYCIMRTYLNFSPLTVYLDPGPSIARILEIARRNPDRMVRVGTGEVGDSLFLDPAFRLSERFVEALAACPNVHFEMKTKTHFVDHLLDIPRKGNAVLGFSLNPPQVVRACEGTASSLDERLAAAERAAAAGYRLAFHFDPVVLVPGWREAYGALARRLRGFPLESVAWISLGTLRYLPELKDALGEQEFLLEEFVPCADGKLRYLQPVRSAVYRHVLQELGPLAAAPVYLCMESPAVWRNVFGNLPGKRAATRAIFEAIRDV